MYAEVTNGVVTKIVSENGLTPDQKVSMHHFHGPVAIGWLFNGHAFTPPPEVPEIVEE